MIGWHEAGPRRGKNGPSVAFRSTCNRKRGRGRACRERGISRAPVHPLSSHDVSSIGDKPPSLPFAASLPRYKRDARSCLIPTARTQPSRARKADRSETWTDCPPAPVRLIVAPSTAVLSFAPSLSNRAPRGGRSLSHPLTHSAVCTRHTRSLGQPRIRFPTSMAVEAAAVSEGPVATCPTSLTGT
eukprot:scaffold215902_cov31-Tisochrysis_lutea.AAC.6